MARPVAFLVPAGSLGCGVGAAPFFVPDGLARQCGLQLIPLDRAVYGGGHFRDAAAVSGSFLGQRIVP